MSSSHGRSGAGAAALWSGQSVTSALDVRDRHPGAMSKLERTLMAEARSQRAQLVRFETEISTMSIEMLELRQRSSIPIAAPAVVPIGRAQAEVRVCTLALGQTTHDVPEIDFGRIFVREKIKTPLKFWYLARGHMSLTPYLFVSFVAIPS